MSGPLLTLAAVAAYGILHSLLASSWAKGLARRTIGPTADRLYRLAFNLIGAVGLLPVLAVVALTPGSLVYRLAPPWSVLAAIGQAASLALLAVGVWQTDAWHFLGLRQLSPSGRAGPATLVITGLYRWVRHPLYTLGLVFLWLTPVMTTSLLALNIGMTVYVVVGSIFEERRLAIEFGPAYDDYRKRVPRLLPLPRPRVERRADRP